MPSRNPSIPIVLEVMRKLSSQRTEIEINVPTERVWAILTDFAHMTDWMPTQRDYSGPSADEIAVGAVFPHRAYERGGEGGFRFFKRSSEIIAIEKGKSLSINTTGSLGFIKTLQVHWTLQSDANSTIVVGTVDYALKMGIMGAILNKAFFGRQIASRMKEMLSNLKQFAETGEKVASPHWMPTDSYVLGK
jgi:uncharacterized membrane protein